VEIANAELFENINDIVDDFRVAMLISIGSDNLIEARPMSVASHNERSGDIYFITSALTGKTDDIENNPLTGVTLQSSTQFVSLSGQATVFKDHPMISELFATAWKAWFPEGTQQSDIRLIKFNPDKGEYWDMSGMRGLKFLWKAGKAILQDEKLAMDDDPESHGKVKM